MPQYNRAELGRMATESGFVRDTFEKVLRLKEILRFMNEDEFLREHLLLKGGTAINLTVFNLPRLSVDIDMDYTPNDTREDMLECREKITNDNMKQVVIKRLLKQSESEMNPKFVDFAGFYGFKPVLCRPYRGQTKGKVERTVRYVRENFMVGIRYHSLDDLNGQALAWCRKVNNRVHGTTNKIPTQQLAEECLQPMLREYITDKMNVRKVEKDCLISYAGNKYSVPAEYIGKDVTVLVLKNMLSVYHNGEQIALHRLSYNKNDITVNKEHYRPLMTRQIFHVKNTMYHGVFYMKGVEYRF